MTTIPGYDLGVERDALRRCARVFAWRQAADGINDEYITLPVKPDGPWPLAVSDGAAPPPLLTLTQRQAIALRDDLNRSFPLPPPEGPKPDDRLLTIIENLTRPAA